LAVYETAARQASTAHKEEHFTWTDLGGGRSSDLEVILEQMGLTFFRGMGSRGWSLGEVPYVFRRPEAVFNWKIVTGFQYKFGVNS